MSLTRKTITTFLISLLILTLALFIKKLNLNVIQITEKEKCPACFGVSMCQDIADNSVTLEYTDFYSFFNNMLSVKNVYYGSYKNQKVIMKKLAHKAELDGFDDMICTNPDLLELCHTKSDKKYSKIDFHKTIITELSNQDLTDPNNKLIMCPTTTNIYGLFKSVQVESTVKHGDYYKFLWSSIKINPEPIILQMLPAEDGWPTPEYFGACGRLIIEEYVGSPLSSFYEEPWLKRAKIAASLLDAAHKFTFKNSKFAFYLTDMSEDNIAVNEQDEAIFVDLENIIIVDKYPPTDVTAKLKTWNERYANNVDADCEDCFVFSPVDICQHKISDHNYYAICQHILVQGLSTDAHDQGFLHDPPDDILEKYPTLKHLLQRCARPDPSESRIDLGIRLKKLLDSITKYTK